MYGDGPGVDHSPTSTSSAAAMSSKRHDRHRSTGPTAFVRPAGGGSPASFLQPGVVPPVRTRRQSGERSSSALMISFTLDVLLCWSRYSW